MDEGGSVSDYPGFKQDPNDIAKAIPQLVSWLTDTGDYKNDFVYTTVTQHVTDMDSARSWALRLLIHYLGDIHQPLHATSRVDSKYPNGDAGGNLFPMKPKGGAKNLHAVWDSVLYEFTKTPTLVFI